MPQDIDNDRCSLFTISIISSIFVALLFLWQGHKGFSLGDEGFLWYGVQRVLVGEIPIRDFMAYDPGRYYSAAALLYAFGDNGIISLRIVIAIFQAIGLFVALFLIKQSSYDKSKAEVLFLLTSAMLLILWMYPRHKLFDITLSIFLIGILTFLIKNPIPKRYLITGVCVGLIAVFGRNHGVYGAVGSLGAIAWLSIKKNTGLGFVKALVLWGVGITIGYLPVFFMILLIPEFASAFWDGIRFLFERGTTNFPLPVPWPWTASLSNTSLNAGVRDVLIGLFFIGILAFGLLAIFRVSYCRSKENSVPPALVASAFLAFPYAHFAFSRPDVGHLAQGIFPLLVGCLVILSNSQSTIRWPLLAISFFASFWVMHPFHPGWQCLASKQCVNVEISGSNLQVLPHTANEIALLRDLKEQYASNGQSFIATPFWPGAYALFEKKSPMWANYALWKRGSNFELKEIERIKAANPSFVIVLDLPLDGREELRFRNTHPIVFNYIQTHYRLLSQPSDPYQIFTPRIEQTNS